MPLPELILTPTSLERAGLLANRRLSAGLAEKQIEIAICGFGPIAAAAATARLLCSRPVSRVLLAGIAGSYESSLPVGTAWQVETVGCWGIGFGSGSDFRLATDFGWRQVPVSHRIDSPVEILPLSTTTSPDGKPHVDLALTCTAASSGPADCELRRACFPRAGLEEMEGFGVALACLDHQLATGREVGLMMIRGVSNLAGDRARANWRIEPALSAIAELLLELLTRESDPQGKLLS